MNEKAGDIIYGKKITLEQEIHELIGKFERETAATVKDVYLERTSFDIGFRENRNLFCVKTIIEV